MMTGITGRLLTLALIGSVAVSPLLAQQSIDTPNLQLAPNVVQLDGVPMGSLVTMLLRDIVRTPYVISPDVLSDRRPISVRLIMPRAQLRPKVLEFLGASGLFTRSDPAGTVYVSRRSGGMGGGGGYVGGGREVQNPGGGGGRGVASMMEPRQLAPIARERFVRNSDYVPMGSPLERSPSYDAAPQATRSADATGSQQLGSTAQPLDVEQELLAYIPAHRDPAYLASILLVVLPNVTLGARDAQQGDGVAADVLEQEGPDVLVMAGSSADLARARSLIAVLDRARPMVSVKAVVMQVSSVNARGSALSVLASIAGVDVGAGGPASTPAGSQFLRLGSGALQAVLAVVNEDSRVKVVATPNLAALSGGVATINAGAQVPTVGAVTAVEGSAPVQSIVYRDSGITLTVRPVVRGELIQLEVREERSTFIRTTTGVEDSPTLQKSSASATVIVKNGESVLLAGLNEESQDRTKEGLFGGLLGVRTRSDTKSELMVLLTAEIVPTAATPSGTFIDIGGEAGEPSVTLPAPIADEWQAGREPAPLLPDAPEARPLRSTVPA